MAGAAPGPTGAEARVEPPVAREGGEWQRGAVRAAAGAASRSVPLPSGQRRRRTRASPSSSNIAGPAPGPTGAEARVQPPVAREGVNCSGWAVGATVGGTGEATIVPPLVLGVPGVEPATPTPRLPGLATTPKGETQVFEAARSGAGGTGAPAPG